MMEANSNNKILEKMNRDKKRMAYFNVIAAATFWGTLGIYVKVLHNFGLAPLQIVFVRATGAAVILLPSILIKNKKLLKINLRDYIFFLGTGIMSFDFYNWCYFVAIDKTSLSIAAILLYTAPTFVMLFSVILFKEKLSTKKIISLVLTFVGCSFVTVFVPRAGQNITVAGILAGLGSGLGYALYSIFGRYVLKKYSPLIVTLYTFLFASIALIPVTNIKGIVSLFSNINVLFYVFMLCISTTVLPFLLYTKGLSHLDTSNASIIATLEPIVAIIIGIVLYNEPITVFKIAGILIVIFAVFIIRE